MVHGDGIAWLRENALADGDAIVTSMPDHSELPLLGIDGWTEWFVGAAELICRSVTDSSVAIFYQTDVKLDGRWLDKSLLVARGAERAGSHLLWHKIVCRSAPGTVGFGRPAYAHMVCYSRARRLEPGQSTVDVIPRLGEMPWPRAMGTQACHAAGRFLKRFTDCTTVIDPFCGHGTMLEIANQIGLAAIGVELSRKRVKRARQLFL